MDNSKAKKKQSLSSFTYNLTNFQSKVANLQF